MSRSLPIEEHEQRLDMFKRPETTGFPEPFGVLPLDMWSIDPVETPPGQSTNVRERVQSL